MKRTENIDKISVAICNAQAEIANPKKNKKAKLGGNFSFEYADLPSIIEATKPILHKHGLSVVTTESVCDNGLMVITTLLHTSGQFMESEFFIAGDRKPIEIGSMITYGRRYMLTSMLNIAAEDDMDAGPFNFGETPSKADALNAAAKAKAQSVQQKE